MKALLEYWNENINGVIGDNILQFDNENGKGVLDIHFLTENLHLFRIDLYLLKPIKGKPYIFEDEEEYVSIIFGDASAMFFGGSINISLDGVLISNNKTDVEWTLGIKKSIQLIVLRVKYDYFYKMVDRTPSLQTIFQKDNNYTVFEEMSTLIKGTFYRMFEINESNYKQELLYACGVYLFHLLIDKLSLRESIKERNSAPLNFKSLMQARAMILETVGPPIEIDDLAKNCGMSSSGLRINFKNTFGVPIYQFQQKVRLEKAKELLIERDKSISMISVELGFSNVSHFASVFKKEYELTPKQYQLQELKK